MAFSSLWLQIDGLIGSNGILPLRDHLDQIAGTAEGNPFWDAPTLFWWWPTDTALHVGCGLGCALSIALIAGFPIEGPVLLGLWALYLSLSHAGQVFLGFQWDTLLLETLAVCTLIARWHPRSPREPSVLGMWVLRLLLFKLMLGSGLVKLTSGDPTWWDGTALSYHYWTQPLPNPLSWWMHHAPMGWHKLETWATLIIEIPLPFLIFAGRTGRVIAFIGFSLVLAMLFFTGNYGFFQILSMVLVFSLLDDGQLRWLQRRVLRPKPPEPPWIRDSRTVLIGSLAMVWVGLSLPMQYGRTWSYQDLDEAHLDAVRTIYPFRSINAYGLFANMTEDRPEIRIEGSDDGEHWEPYVFRYKPGPPERRPPFIPGYMPRLDWQMWFAAMSSCGRSAWVQQLMARLQDNEPAVLGLIANNPFPEQGPRFIRAQLNLYPFTDSGPDWWRVSQAEQPYCRVVER